MENTNSNPFAKQYLTAPIRINSDEAQIIETVLKYRRPTRSDIISETRWSKAKVSQKVNALIEIGYLTEQGEGPSTGGRKPHILKINKELGYIVGIDFGATSVDIALADLEGSIIGLSSESADVREPPEKILKHCRDIINGMIKERDIQSEEILGVGIGVPGPVNFDKRVLVAPPLMPHWENFPICRFLNSTFSSAIVVVDNDVNIMAIGEKFSGYAKDIDHYLVVKIGTGIGCGIVTDKKIHRGNDGCAGDIGHICVEKNGPICRCGNHGCLEAMASGPAIAGKAEQIVGEGKSDFLKKLYESNGGFLTPEDVNAACREGDEAALAIIRESGEMIGDVLAGLVNFFNPSLIIITGGISNFGNHLLIAIKRAVLRRSLPLATSHLNISFSQTGPKAGILGAIYLVLGYLFVTDDTMKFSFLRKEC